MQKRILTDDFKCRFWEWVKQTSFNWNWGGENFVC